MRRILLLLLTAALPLTLLAFSPTLQEEEAGEDSTTAEGEEGTTDEPAVVTPDPLDVTMYMHGEGDRYVDETSFELAGPPKTMDREEPTGDDFDSMQLLNYGIGPNPNCAGNSLFPVWTGFVGDGTVVGDATVTLHVVGSTGGDVTVNVWADVTGQACNEAYPTPDATADVTLPAGNGSVEVTLPTDGLDPDFSIMVQVQPKVTPPLQHMPTTQARVLYDGADHQTSIVFTCQPDDVVLEEGQTIEDVAPTEVDCLPF